MEGHQQLKSTSSKAAPRNCEMTTQTKRIVAIAVLVTAGSLVWADPTFAQCVMCRASLAGNSSFARNLNIGVLVLLVPPVSVFCAIFFLAFRRRK